MVNEKTATPSRWLVQGEALVDSGPKPLAVWSGIPGETALIRLDGRGERYNHAHYIDAREPSPHRVIPSCERYSLCGACPLMHVNAEGQEEARRRIVEQTLGDAGLGDVPIHAFHPSPDGNTAYRHVVRLGFGYSDRGRMRVGAWARQFGSIVPIPACQVVVPVLRQSMISMAHFAIEHDIWPWDPNTGRGVLRSVVLRASRTTGEVLVTLIAARRTRELAELAEDLAGGVSSIAGVWLHLNDDEDYKLLSRDEFGEIGALGLIGKATIEETVGNLTYAIGATDEFLENPAILPVLFERFAERAGLEDGVPVLELNSGIGTFTLQAAAKTGWALGVDRSEVTVTRARESARRNGLTAEFVCGELDEVLPDLARRLRSAQPVVVINNFQRGLQPEVFDQLVALKPRRIVYLSDNPAALASDLAAWQERGLRAGPAELFDVAPHAAKTRVLVTLEGTESAQPSARGPRRKVVR